MVRVPFVCAGRRVVGVTPWAPGIGRLSRGGLSGILAVMVSIAFPGHCAVELGEGNMANDAEGTSNGELGGEGVRISVRVTQLLYTGCGKPRVWHVIVASS